MVAVSVVLWLLSSGGVDSLAHQRLLLHRPTLEGLLTSHLFHTRGWHLGLDIVLLLIVGGALETRWGFLRFLGFYLVTAWGVTTFSLLAGSVFAPAGAVSCGSTGVAMGCLVAAGSIWPRMRLAAQLPPLRSLVWGGILLLATLLAACHDAGSEEPLFLLPQVSGVAFGLLFLLAEPFYEQSVARWRLRRDRARRRRVGELRHRVDSLLEKISAQGAESLTRDEKVFLQRASKHYRQE